MAPSSLTLAPHPRREGPLGGAGAFPVGFPPPGASPSSSVGGNGDGDGLRGGLTSCNATWSGVASAASPRGPPSLSGSSLGGWGHRVGLTGSPVLRCWCLCRKNARRGDEKTSSCPTLPPPPARAPHPLAAAACPWAAASPCISGLDRAAAAHCEAHCCRLPPPLLRPALPRSSTATPPATPCTLSALASLFSPPRPPARPAVGPVVTKVEHYLRRGGGRQGRRRLDFFLAVAGWR